MNRKSLPAAIVRRYAEHGVGRAAASLTYYLLFTVFPFLIVVCVCLSFGEVLDFLTSSLSNIIPAQALELVESYIRHVQENDSGQLLGSGLVLMLWSCYRVVSAIVSSMNRAWGVHAQKGFLRETFRLFGLTVFIMLSVFLIIALLMLNTSLLHLVTVYKLSVTIFVNSWGLLRYVLLATTLYVIMAILFRHGPNRTLTLRQVMPGVLFSLVCWLISSLLFAWYAANIANYTNIYGSLGAIIVLLLWLHLGSFSIIIGSEINALLDERKHESYPVQAEDLRKKDT